MAAMLFTLAFILLLPQGMCLIAVYSGNQFAITNLSVLSAAYVRDI